MQGVRDEMCEPCDDEALASVCRGFSVAVAVADRV